jgi:hypothetical protein
MADKIKSKFFRIATEGATTDGRTIDREWLAQMAKNYNPKTFGARVNLEHIKGILPDGPFKAYGDVVALKAEEIDGKLTLLAQIDPTPDLVALTKARQKVYTSCEIAHKFADTGEAYLVGLAVTDDPASLGTEMLQFSAKAEKSPLTKRKQNADNLFSEAVEVSIEFEPVEGSPGLLDKIKTMFSKRGQADDAKFADVHAAVEEIAGHVAGMEDKFASASAMAKVTAAHEKLSADFTALQEKLSKEPATQTRAPSTGGATEVKTDC